MVQFSNSIETAVENRSEAMVSREHFKNGVSLKKLMSRFHRFIFLFPFLFYSFLLKAQFDNEKYDKYFFLIGTLNEYMGYQRTFTHRDSGYYYQLVDITNKHNLKYPLFIDSLFRLEYSDIRIVNTPGAPQGIMIYSPTLSLKIDDYYNYEPSGRLHVANIDGLIFEQKDTWISRVDTLYAGHLKKERFETDKQKLSFLLGVYLRYNREEPDRTIQPFKNQNLLEENSEFEYVFYMPNAQSKAKICVEILKDLGCNVEYIYLQNIPAGHFAIFTPSNKIREVINEAERLKKYIETINTNKIYLE